MAEIAVIVPVYNAEHCLRRCVDSVLSQSFHNVALVLVDDGSGDGSPAICDEYAQKDDRVRVIHQENSGPSAARNRGIELALQENCRYLAFVDSDDQIHPQYLDYLHYLAVAQGAQIAMCRHQYVTPAEPMPEPEELPEEPGHLIDAETLMCSESASFNYAWGKLFAADLFAQLRFPEDVSFGEDNLTVYKAFFACERIAFSQRKLYYYFYNPGGITKTRWKPDSLQCFLGIREQLAFYRERGYERAYRKETELYIQQCAYQLHRIRDDKAHRRENRPHETMLRRQMAQLLRDNPAFRETDNPYWHEALHPHSAAARRLGQRVRTNIRENGVLGTGKKLLNRLSRERRGSLR